MKHTLPTLSLVLSLFSLPAFSTVLHWPECDTGLLKIQNKSNQSQKVWIQTFKPTLIAETESSLQALETVQISLSKKSKSERQALLHFSNPKDIDATFQCGNGNLTKNYYATNLEGGVQTFRKSDLAQQSIALKNLYTEKNTFKIEVLNKFRQTLRTITHTLSSNEQRKVLLLPTPELAYLRIKADHKFAAFNLNSVGSQNAMIADTQQFPEDTSEGIYFEVGPRSGSGDSFTVKITNPALIEKARLQISNPTLEKMLFGKIQKGHQKQNRNLASTTKSFWNWSVTEVTNIADFGSTACNGLPQIVDDRIDSWVKDPGRICFWTYRIKREVPASEIATGQKLF